MSVALRLRQGLRAIFAFARPVDNAFAANYLSPSELALFKRLKRSERLHAINVLCDVTAQSPETPRDLAKAALLHDIGKMKYSLGVWQKTLAVVLRRMTPAVYRRWSAGDPNSAFQRACIVAEQHPEWGATLLKEAGASGRVIWLARRHADPPRRWSTHPDFALLQRLQAADNNN